MKRSITILLLVFSILLTGILYFLVFVPYFEEIETAKILEDIIKQTVKGEYLPERYALTQEQAVEAMPRVSLLGEYNRIEFMQWYKAQTLFIAFVHREPSNKRIINYGVTAYLPEPELKGKELAQSTLGIALPMEGWVNASTMSSNIFSTVYVNDNKIYYISSIQLSKNDYNMLSMLRGYVPKDERIGIVSLEVFPSTLHMDSRLIKKIQSDELNMFGGKSAYN